MTKFKRLFVTYTKSNSDTGEVYSGLASDEIDESLSQKEMARKILNKRDSGHHKNKEGFLPPQVDKISTDYDAMRGREQNLIEYNGGAKSEGGISGNEINSISHRNKKRSKYLEAAAKLFGGLFILYLLLLLWK
jgi:hypothetical protein